MIKLYTLGPDPDLCGQAFTCYLMGKLPPCTIVAQGLSLIFMAGVPDGIPESMVETGNGPVSVLHSSETEGKTRLAWRVSGAPSSAATRAGTGYAVRSGCGAGRHGGCIGGKGNFISQSAE